MRHVLDTPQALALVLPHKLILYEKWEEAEKAWDGALHFDSALGGGSLKIRIVADCAGRTS